MTKLDIIRIPAIAFFVLSIGAKDCIDASKYNWNNVAPRPRPRRSPFAIQIRLSAALYIVAMWAWPLSPRSAAI